MHNDNILSSIEQKIGLNIKNKQPISGGCIAETCLLTCDNGQKFFLKSGFSNHMFCNEANSLKELTKSRTLRIPEVFSVGENYLLLEFIENGLRSPDFFKNFGTHFAKLHKFTNTQFGFYEDNFIGSTPQINSQSYNWLDFWFENRLLFQYRLAEKNGYVNKSLKTEFRSIEKKIYNILDGCDEPPCLLHGDLWGGNYMIDNENNAVLIDPAVYYGHREADLAMTKLFGGFSPDFYKSYQKAFPLKEGFQYRENIYLLYHVLNHLNLFGTTYQSQAISLMESYH